MPRMPEGKKGLYIYLDDSVYDALFSLIHQKYHGFRGVVSSEVQDAIVSWLRTHDTTLTQTSTKFNPEIPISHVRARKIIQELFKIGSTNQCSLKDLYWAIGNVRGHDPRTIRKWAKFLVQHTYLKILAPNIFEIL